METMGARAAGLEGQRKVPLFADKGEEQQWERVSLRRKSYRNGFLGVGVWWG